MDRDRRSASGGGCIEPQPAGLLPRLVDMRYGEQVFEIATPLDGIGWTPPDPLPKIVERFHRRHGELYTYSLPDHEAVLVNDRATVAGILSELPQEPHLPWAAPAAPRSERQVYLDDRVTAPVYDFDALAPAARMKLAEHRFWKIHALAE